MKQQTFIIHSFSVSGIQEQLSWVVLAQEVAVKMLAGLWSHLKGWLIGAGGPISKRADSHVCWQEASVPHHGDCFSVSTAWHLAFPRTGIQERRSYNAFYDLVSEVTLSFVPYSIH